MTIKLQDFLFAVLVVVHISCYIAGNYDDG